MKNSTYIHKKFFRCEKMYAYGPCLAVFANSPDAKSKKNGNTDLIDKVKTWPKFWPDMYRVDSTFLLFE